MIREHEISYQELKGKILNEFTKLGEAGLYQRGILATCVNNHVTARRQRFVADGLSLYCWTYRTRKIEQILKNPNVAVAIGFIQVEGTAFIRGHPYDEKNARVIQVLRETQPEFYESYKYSFEKPDDMYLIEVVPERIALADMKGIAYMYFDTREAYRVRGEYWTELQEDHKDAPNYWR